MSNQVAIMAERLSVEPAELQSIVMNTLMPGGNVRVTNEQFLSFMAVANEYQLNPMTKEIYAFPNRGGIQPIVSIDGWLKIINSHPQFNGMEFKDNLNDGVLMSITCRMFRSDRDHAIEVTEYLSECKKNTEPWNKWPARMLRHKATIQAARYAFGFSGIVDPDEAERIQSVHDVDEKDITPTAPQLEYYPKDNFDSNFPKWEQAVQEGKKTPAELIMMIESKLPLTDTQKNLINQLGEEL